MTAALQGGVPKVIFASSGGAIHGELLSLPVGEDTTTRPLSPYGEDKMLTENLLLQHAARIETVILRYGPVIFGDGTQTRDYVCLDDVAQANLLAQRYNLHGVLNIATDKGLALLEVYRQIAAHLQIDGNPSIFQPHNRYEAMHNVLGIQRARTESGWQPEVSFEAGLAPTEHHIASQVRDPAPH